jgi:hypothetical protein
LLQEKQILILCSHPFSTVTRCTFCSFHTFFQTICHNVKNEQPLISDRVTLLICCLLDVKKNRQNNIEQQNLTKVSELWIYAAKLGQIHDGAFAFMGTSGP